MTSEQKIANIEAQIAACERGATNVITCPYCGEQNTPGEPICCDCMAVAVDVILDRKEIDEHREHFERIMDKVSKN